MRTNTSDMAWAAGLFDGEGCISRPNPSAVRLDLGMHPRDTDILKRFKRVMGCGNLYGPYNNCTHWIAYSREECVSALISMWPWLGLRRKAKAAKFFPKLKPFVKRRSI